MVDYRCDFCSFVGNSQKDIKKVLNKRHCKDCYRERRKKKYSMLRSEQVKEDIANGVIKIGRPKIIRNKETIVLDRPKRIQVLPFMKGQFTKIRSIKLALSFMDKQFLFGKLIRSGLSYDDADKRVRELNSEMISLGKELRKANKPDTEKLNNFREQFARMCESL